MLHTPENSESFSCHIQNRGNVGRGMRDGGREMQFLTYHRIASRFPKYIYTYMYIIYTRFYECLYGTLNIINKYNMILMNDDATTKTRWVRWCVGIGVYTVYTSKYFGYHII